MENNEQRPVTAERLKDLINLHNIMATGDTSEYKPDELIKLSGIMAEAAAAFYFSEKANSQYTKNIVAAMYTEVMEARHSFFLLCKNTHFILFCQTI